MVHAHLPRLRDIGDALLAVAQHPARLALAAPVGFCMVTRTIACNTLMQTMSGDASRSRIMALYTLVIIGMLITELEGLLRAKTAPLKAR